MSINGETILNELSLKQGVVSKIDVSVKDFLSPVLDEPCDLPSQTITSYGFFAARFLHSSVGHFDRLSTQKDTTRLISAVHICYECTRKHRDLIKLKDPMAIQNLLYHIITKIQNKGVEHIDKVLTFATILYEELHHFSENLQESMLTLAKNSFILLWNSAIKVGKDISFIVDTSRLRLAALKFAILGQKEKSVIVERALSVIIAHDSIVSRNKLCDNETLISCHEIFDELLNVLKLYLIPSPTENYSSDNLLSYVDAVLHYSRYLARNLFSSNAVKVLSSLISYCDEMSKNHSKSTALATVLRECCVVVRIGTNLSRNILLDQQKNKLNVTNTVCVPAGLKRCNEVIEQLFCLVASHPALLQLASDSYQFVKSQQDVFLKQHKEKTQDLSSEVYDSFTGSLDVLIKLYQLQQTHCPKNPQEDPNVAKSRQSCAKKEIDVRCNRLCILLDKSQKEAVSESGLLLPHVMACLDELSCIITLFSKDSALLISHEHHVVGWLGQMFGRLCFENSLFVEAGSFFEIACKHLVQWCKIEKDSKMDPKIQLWRRHEDLVETHRKLQQFEQALDVIAAGLLVDPSHLTSAAESWARIKRDISRKDPNSPICKRTLRTTLGDKHEAIDLIRLLRLEFHAYKSRSRMHVEQQAVLHDLLDLCTDPLQRATTLIDLAQLKWTHSIALPSQQCGSSEAKEATTLLDQLLQKNPTAEIKCALARAYLWFYIIHLKTSKQLQRKETEREKTTNQVLPSTPTSDDEDDNIQDEHYTITMEIESMQPIARSLVLWEQLVDAYDQVTDTSLLPVIVESLQILMDIFHVASKPLETYRCACVLVCFSSMDLGQHISYYLAGVTRQLSVLVELQQYDHAHKLCDETDGQLSSISRPPPPQSVILYILAKASLMFSTHQTRKGNILIEEAQTLKDSNFKGKTKDSCLLDGSIRRLQSSHFLLSRGPPDGVNQNQALTNTDVYPLDMAFDAFRWHTGVINHLIGRVYVTKEGMDLSPKDNSPEKWHAVDEVLCSLLHIGRLYLYIGDAREAKAYLKEGLHIARYFNLPRRSTEFQLTIVKLTNISGKFGDSQAGLNNVNFVLASNEQITDVHSDIGDEEMVSKQDCFGFESDTNESENDDFIKSKLISMKDHLSNQNAGSPVLQRQTPKLPSYVLHEDGCECDSCRDITMHRMYSKFFVLEAECLLYQSLENQAKEFANLALQFYKQISDRTDLMVKCVVSKGITTDKSSIDSRERCMFERELMEILCCLTRVNLDVDAEEFHKCVQVALQHLGQGSEVMSEHAYLHAFMLYAQVVSLLPLDNVLPQRQSEVKGLCEQVGLMTLEKTDKMLLKNSSSQRNNVMDQGDSNEEKATLTSGKGKGIIKSTRKKNVNLNSDDVIKIQTKSVMKISNKESMKSVQLDAPLRETNTPSVPAAASGYSVKTARVRRGLSSTKTPVPISLQTPTVTTAARVYHGIKKLDPSTVKSEGQEHSNITEGQVVRTVRGSRRGQQSAANTPASSVRSRKAVQSLGSMINGSDDENMNQSKKLVGPAKTTGRTNRKKNNVTNQDEAPVNENKKPISSLFKSLMLQDNVVKESADMYKFQCSDSEKTPKIKKKGRPAAQGKKTGTTAKTRAGVNRDLDKEVVRKSDPTSSSCIHIKNHDIFDIDNLSDEENIPPLLPNLSKSKIPRSNKVNLSTYKESSSGKLTAVSAPKSRTAVKQMCKPIRLTRAKTGALENRRDSDDDDLFSHQPLDGSLCLADDESEIDEAELSLHSKNKNLEYIYLNKNGLSITACDDDGVALILPEVCQVNNDFIHLDDSIEMFRAASCSDEENRECVQKRRQTRKPKIVNKSTKTRPENTACEKVRACSESDDAEERNMAVKRRARRGMKKEKEQFSKEDCELVRSVKVKDRSNTSGLMNKSSTEAGQTQAPPADESLNVLENLLPAYQLLQGLPSAVLYRAVCQALALCHLESDKTAAAFYLTEATAVTFRHNVLDNVGKRLRKLHKPEDRVTASGSSSDRCDEEMLQYTRQILTFNKTIQDLEACINAIPEGWTVCHISVVTPKELLQAFDPASGHMVITRYRRGHDPYVLPLPGYHRKASSLLEKFDYIMTESKSNMQVTDKLHWWNVRTELNHALKECVEALEDEWLGVWKGVLSGCYSNIEDQNKVRAAVKSVRNIVSRLNECKHVDEQAVEILLTSSHLLSESQFDELVSRVTGLAVGSQHHDQIKGAALRQAKQLNLSVSKHQPVILILDKCIQHLPWENLPVLQQQQVTRSPSLYFLSSHLQRARSMPTYTRGVWPTNAYYILNPDNNLPHTQDKFQDAFSKEKGWQGIVCQAPSPEQYTAALTQYDLFVYCGHGSGSKYLAGDSLQMLDCGAAVMLMGCSSGRLTTDGHLEAAGMIHNYWLAGCPSIIANLWDVTDKDIDRFLESLLKEWLTSSNGTSLSAVVPLSRAACRLQHLIGAAPVIYGLPITVSR